MNSVPFTKDGFERMKKELERLKKVERPQNIKAIEEARAHGDLSENAEFEAAKEKQALIEAMINKLSYNIGNADVIHPDSLPKDKAVFGNYVLLENIETGDESKYQLVGPEESSIEEGRISVTSPLGKAMLGKKVGDEVVLNAPGGKRNYEVIEIL